MSSGEFVPDSEEEAGRAPPVARVAPRASANRELAAAFAAETTEFKDKWKQTKNNWYEIEPKFELPFPEEYQTSEPSGEPIWLLRARDIDVMMRLQGNRENDGNHEIPHEIGRAHV